MSSFLSFLFLSFPYLSIAINASISLPSNLLRRFAFLEDVQAGGLGHSWLCLSISSSQIQNLIGLLGFSAYDDLCVDTSLIFGYAFEECHFCRNPNTFWSGLVLVLKHFLDSIALTATSSSFALHLAGLLIRLVNHLGIFVFNSSTEFESVLATCLAKDVFS